IIHVTAVVGVNGGGPVCWLGQRRRVQKTVTFVEAERRRWKRNSSRHVEKNATKDNEIHDTKEVCLKLIGKSAAEVQAIMTQLGDFDPREYPVLLDAMMGTELALKVKM
ncbi:hypothetical protein A2U01_0014781, partial [Trifolium medium]|nr:hypothetical protein [Trifolium medium]